MTENNVIISIAAEQTAPNGETNHIEMVTEGRYYEQAGTQYLEYEESESSGMSGTKTMMMITDGIVSLVRSGYTTSHMVFSSGKKSYNVYNTPVGSMEMAVVPTDMHVDISGESGEIVLEYELEVGGHYTGDNMISVAFKAKNSTDAEPRPA